MTSAITPFEYNHNPVRIIQGEGGEPWFVAKDVCDVLGIKNSRHAVAKLDDDEKGVVQNDTLGGAQEMTTISESGLYALIIRSDKPEAKKFRKWITAEVLPSIRKTGSYTTGQTGPARPATLAPVATSLRQAESMAKIFGLEGSQALLSADRAVNAFHGISPMALLEVSYLTNEDQERHLIPSDIAKELGLSSAKRANQLLKEAGLQTDVRNHKGKLNWVATEEGKAFAILKDCGKKHSDGTPVTHLHWTASVIPILEAFQLKESGKSLN